MGDDKMLTFLAGLQVHVCSHEGDVYVLDSDDDVICDFVSAGSTTRSVEETAQAIVTSCHEYARWLPVIEAAQDFEEARREFIATPPAERTGEQYDAEWTARHALLDAALRTAKGADHE